MKKILQLCILCLCMGVGMNAYAGVQDAALFKAILSSNVQAVKQALAQGAGVEARNDFGNTPLLVACQFGNVAVIQLLIDNNADVNASRTGAGHTPLAMCVSNMQIVKVLLANGARINAQDKQGQTALMFASRDVFEQIIPVIELLLKHGANAKLKDKNGKTALDHAYVARTEAFSEERKKVSTRIIQILKKHR